MVSCCSHPVTSPSSASKYNNTAEEAVKAPPLPVAAARSGAVASPGTGRAHSGLAGHVLWSRPWNFTSSSTRTHLRCNIKNKPNNNHLLWNGLTLELCNGKFLLKIIVLNGENKFFFFFNDKLGKSLQRYCRNGMYSLRKATMCGFEVETWWQMWPYRCVPNKC